MNNIENQFDMIVKKHQNIEKCLSNQGNLYKDKLIIVADKSNLFMLANLLNKLNLLNSYNINIELIKKISSNLELYQVIID